MVYLHFPSQFTEEEEMLQKKYQKLRRKKKAFQQLKAPKQEPPSNQSSLKNQIEVKKDAKEVAKKLLQSGAISAIKVENKERQGFKRPKASERKRVGSEKLGSTVTGYQPFTSSHPAEEEPAEFGRPAMKGLYESFVSSRETEDGDSTEDKERENEKSSRPERPQQGNTVYVHGYGVTEDILRNGFQPFGNIINISMEMDRHCGFVTFDTIEAADKAIKEMNGQTVSRVQLKVSLARRQPLIPSATDGASSWSGLASYSPKGNHKDKRNLVSYDDIF
ncbi:negative elongation factor E [Centruroides vittatus]|uniref:negative elongation factor E n=1 Tax=Centruroides vittatus TaxID=120091 RepID=UPI0035107817